MQTCETTGKLEIGVDEAGRGPLFGRVYAAAVIWHPDKKSPLIKDSKLIKSAKGMKEAYDYIVTNSVAYCVAYATEEEIDNLNILNATMKAMHRAIAGCYLVPDTILVDGDKFQIYTPDEPYSDVPIEQITVVKGDSKFYSIAAASILAKYERDKYVDELCDKYPALDELYDLRSNKGYGTKSHIDGISHHGISQFHRKTFARCKGEEVFPV
jgi:ribonuclease HII